MPSAARHRLFLIESRQKQILRYAQDDRVWGFSAACWIATWLPYSRFATRHPRRCDGRREEKLR